VPVVVNNENEYNEKGCLYLTNNYKLETNSKEEVVKVHMKIDEYLKKHQDCVDDDIREFESQHYHLTAKDVHANLKSAPWFGNTSTHGTGEYGDNKLINHISIDEMYGNNHDEILDRLLGIFETKLQQALSDGDIIPTHSENKLYSSKDPVTGLYLICKKDLVICKIMEQAINRGAKDKEGMIQTEEVQSIGESTIHIVAEKIEKSVANLRKSEEQAHLEALKVIDDVAEFLNSNETKQLEDESEN